jgi:chromosome segregation ATPase
LEAAYEKIRYFETLDHVKEIEQLRTQGRELEELNRNLKLEVEQVRYRTDEGQSDKMKEYAERIAFFQSQRESGERERAELRKKVEKLEEELAMGDEREEMLETLTMKVDALEAKNEKLKGELETSSVQLKNATVLGAGKSSEELEQSITTLNEMVALLESEINEEKEKNTALEQQMESNSTRLSELVKLERQLKSRTEETEALRNELEALADSGDFIEKLTFEGIKKDEEIKVLGKRMK